MNKTRRCSLRALFLTAAASLCLFGMPAVTQAEDAPPATAAVEATSVKDQVARLRGKLLYKKNQARRLETQAEKTDSTLKAKIDELNNQKENLYVAVEPKLAEIYQEQKELTRQIEQLNASQANNDKAD